MTDTPAQRDNLLGACHAIGTTFGFDPLLLRIACVLGVLVDFETTLIAYVAAALAVAVARLLQRGAARRTGTGTLQMSAPPAGAM